MKNDRKTRKGRKEGWKKGRKEGRDYRKATTLFLDAKRI